MEQVVERDWHKGPVRENGLQTLLKQLHQLLTLVHGPIESLLEKVSDAVLAVLTLRTMNASWRGDWMLTVPGRISVCCQK